MLLLVSSACKNEDGEMVKTTAKVDSLSRELSRQQQLNDSLLSLREVDQDADNYPIYFGKEFEELEDPENHIIKALKQQEDLIPLKPVLGGTMEFRQIRIISEDWVLAVYDDGHVQGKSIYEYELQDDGEVEFTAVATKLPE